MRFSAFIHRFFREKTALQIRKVIAESKATTEELDFLNHFLRNALEHLATFWTLNKIATWDTVEGRCLHVVLAFKTRGTSTILGLRPEPSAS